MQEIVIYCKKCGKSTRVSHVLTGCDETPVLPNVQISCRYCTRVIRLKKHTEQNLRENSVGGRYYV